MSLDLRTKKQKATDERHAAVASRYRAIRGEAPSASDHSIYCALADEFDLSVTQLRKICLRQNVTTKKRAQV